MPPRAHYYSLTGSLETTAGAHQNSLFRVIRGEMTKVFWLAAVGIHETHNGCRGASILCGIAARHGQSVNLLSLNRFFNRKIEFTMYFAFVVFRGQCLKIAPDRNATLRNKSSNTTSWWLRLVVRPAACLGKMPPKHAAEPLGHPCQSRAPQRVRVRFRIWVGSGQGRPLR